jgi:hypothetical protein
LHAIGEFWLCVLRTASGTACFANLADAVAIHVAKVGHTGHGVGEQYEGNYVAKYASIHDKEITNVHPR